MKTTTAHPAPRMLPEDYAIFIGCSSCCPNPMYQEIAREVASRMAALGIDLVTGGGHRGLMGVIHREFQKNIYDEKNNPNGCKIHVVTIKKYEDDLADLLYTTKTVTDSVSSRKHLLLTLANAALMLPGGSGTTDELATACELHNVGEIDYVTCVFNLDRFFDYIINHYENCVKVGMAANVPFNVAESVDEVFRILGLE